MGCRANLIIVDNDKPQIFYSHWVGNVTPNILAQGLEFCENHFKEFNENGWLLDNASAEGGILIDKDKKNILFFSVEFLETVALQNSFIEFLKNDIWLGWNINWAFRGNVDFAEYLNLMNKNIIGYDFISDFYKIDDWNSLTEELDCEYKHKSLVTLIYKSEVIDYVLVGYNTEINYCVAEGKAVKDKIPKVFKVDKKNQIREFEIEDILLIDYDKKQIFVCWAYDIDDRYINAIRKIWYGWNVERQLKGISFNFDYTERESLFVKISDKEFKDYLNKWKLLEYDKK